MSNTLREDMLNTFLEPIIWSFGCAAERQRMQRHLHIGSMKINVDNTGLIYRTPQDRAKNRAGKLEGPLLAFQARGDINFGANGGKLDRLDAMKELAALLLVAQERARQGTQEHTPGRGQWWTEKRRWGGGSGEAIGKPLDEENTDENMPAETETAPSAAVSVAELFLSTTGSGSGSGDERSPKRRSLEPSLRARDGSGPNEKGAPSREARLLNMRRRQIRTSHELPRSLWNPRIEYLRIGQRPGEAFDDVSLPFNPVFWSSI
jgi:hypothetical protein